MSQWCKENGITFVVVGPEDPLADGIVDYFSKTGKVSFCVRLLLCYVPGSANRMVFISQHNEDVGTQTSCQT